MSRPLVGAAGSSLSDFGSCTSHSGVKDFAVPQFSADAQEHRQKIGSTTRRRWRSAYAIPDPSRQQCRLLPSERKEKQMSDLDFLNLSRKLGRIRTRVRKNYFRCDTRAGPPAPTAPFTRAVRASTTERPAAATSTASRLQAPAILRASARSKPVATNTLRAHRQAATATRALTAPPA